MGRHKGSRNGIVLTRQELRALSVDVRQLGNNRIAAKAGVSSNFMSLLINGKSNASLERLTDIRTAINDLQKEKNNSSKIEETAE